MGTNHADMLIARSAPEGTVPLIAVEGTAYECGQQYAQIIMERYPGYRRYLDGLDRWLNLSAPESQQFERRAAFLIDVHRGMYDVAGPAQATAPTDQAGGCTGFGVCGWLTLDGQSIAGQNKDTVLKSAELFIVLRMRIKDGPTILTLAYPGEVLGYGMWSTGMSLFRTALIDSDGAEHGIDDFGFLALACQSVHEAGEIATKYGLRGCGNYVIGDASGNSVCVEWNAGGVEVLPAKDGISTHANHAEGKTTAPFGDRWDELSDKEDSHYRMHGLWKLLDAERGKLTPQRALMVMADHTQYPRGICRHVGYSQHAWYTTATVVAEPTRGRLHVVRGNPCCNWPKTYRV